MAIAYVAATNALTADSTTDTTLAIATPSSTVGDVILCWINCINGTATAPTITSPATETWTLIGTTTDGASPQLRGALYYRVVAGADSGNPVWSFSTGAHAAAIMVAYRGVSPTTPVTNTSVDAYAGADQFKTTATVVTTDSGWIVSGFGDRSSGSYTAMTDSVRATARVGTATRSAAAVQDSNGVVAAGSQTRTATGPAGTSVGTSFILRLNANTMLPTTATATGTAYSARSVHSPLKEWMFDKGSLYIAHRGGSVDFVEHTAAAYAACHALGIEAIEMSVWKTSDNVWVLSHDQNTSRMFGASVDIPANPWSAISGLLTTNGSHPMARLDDILSLYAGNKIIFIDNKSDTNNSTLLDILDSYSNSTGHFVLKGFYTNVMATAARLRGYLTWGYYYEEDLGDLDATHEKFDILSLEYNDLQASWDQILAKGKKVTGHVCLTLNNVNTSFTRGAHGVMTGKILEAVPNAPAVTATASAVAYDGTATGPGNAPGGWGGATGDAFNASTNVGTIVQSDAATATSVGLAYDATVDAVSAPVAPFAGYGDSYGTAYDAGVEATAIVLFFVTPRRREKIRTRHGLWGRTYIDVGITVLKKDGFYKQYIDPSPEDITAADVVYIGGHVYEIGMDEITDLQAAGYGNWLVNDPSVPIEEIDYSQYGVGFFGTGPYGA